MKEEIIFYSFSSENNSISVDTLMITFFSILGHVPLAFGDGKCFDDFMIFSFYVFSLSCFISRIYFFLKLYYYFKIKILR